MLQLQFLGSIAQILFRGQISCYVPQSCRDTTVCTLRHSPVNLPPQLFQMQTHALAAQPVQCGTNKNEIVSPHCRVETTLIQAIKNN